MIETFIRQDTKHDIFSALKNLSWDNDEEPSQLLSCAEKFIRNATFELMNRFLSGRNQAAFIH